MQHKWLSCFLQKQHDDYFGGAKLYMLHGVLETYPCNQTC